MTVLDSVVRGLADDFVILRELGRGATAVALLATPRDPPGARPVVVKVLLRAIEDAPLLSRFRRELAALSRLDHPGVVRCLGGGSAAGHPYLVSEYHDGVRSLEEVLAGGPLGLERAAVMAAGVAEALAACHAAGFVHRDVKPANVLVRPDDRPVLIDFGLVAGELLGQTKTATGVILGTPAYMAPELLHGLTATPASDRYALGCVLVAMLTGRPAFEGELGGYLAAKSRPYPMTRLRGLPRGLVTLVGSLLDPDPAARPGDEVASRLREAATASLRPAEPTIERGAQRALRRGVQAAGPSGEPSVRGRRIPPRLVVGLAALLVAAVVGWHFMTRSTSRPLERLSFEELGRRSREDAALADLSLPPSCPDAVRGRLYLARHHLAAGRGGPALDLLLPLVREGLPAQAGRAGPLLALATAAARATGEGAVERLRDEVLTGLARSDAAPASREALEGCLTALEPDDRLRVMVRAVARAGGGEAAPDALVGRLLAALGERCPVVGRVEDLAGPVRSTVAAWARVLVAPTAADRSMAMLELRDLDGGAGRLPPRLLRAPAIPPLVRAALDLPSLEALLELLSRFRQIDDRLGEGTRDEVDRPALEALAVSAGLGSPDGLPGPERAREVWAYARDEDLSDGLGAQQVLEPVRGVRWLLAPIWLGLGRPERAWDFIQPFFDAPFAVPLQAEELCRLAGALAGEPAVGSAVRRRLGELRAVETHPERRALLALALVASHRPAVEAGTLVPSDPALEAAGKGVAGDPGLADLPRLVRLPPLVLGSLAWAAGPSPSPGGSVARVVDAMYRAASLVPSVDGFSLEERWLLLLHGRGGRRFTASSPFASVVGRATPGTTTEDRFLAVTSLLLDERRLADWIGAVPVLDADVTEDRQAVVDQALVDWSLFGSLNGLRTVVPDAAERAVLTARVLAMMERRWPAPSLWRKLMLAQVLRTAEDVVQEEETALRGGALDAAARIAGRRLESLVSDGYDRLLQSGHGMARFPEVTLWGAQWFVSRGQGARAEGLLRTLEPQGLPRYLRWRWHLNLATAVAQASGRVDEARELLAKARLLPWAVEDLIRNETVRILTVRHLQSTDGPRGR